MRRRSILLPGGPLRPRRVSYSSDERLHPGRGAEARASVQFVAHPIPEERDDTPILVVAMVLVLGDAEDDGIVRRATVERNAFRPCRWSHCARHLVWSGRRRVQGVTRGIRAATRRGAPV